MPYAILLKGYQDLDLGKTARILAAAKSLVLGDATRAVRHCHGFLARNLSLEEARQVTRELNANGIGCFYTDMDEMYVPPPEQRLVHGAVVPEAFAPADLYGRTTPVEWSNVTLISVGYIPEHKREAHTLGGEAQDDFAQSLGQSLRGHYGLFRRPTVERPERRRMQRVRAQMFLDIFSKEPQEGHWRIDSSGFNYRCLGDRLKSQSDENFRTLVGDVVRCAPNAFGNRGINALLGDQNRKEMTFDDLRSFDEECLWLLQLVYLNLRGIVPPVE